MFILNKVSATISIAGSLSGDEVVQLYITDKESSVVRPLKDLRGIKRISLDSGKSTKVQFTIRAKDLSFFDVKKQENIVEPGIFEIGIGSSSSKMLKTSFEVVE